MYRRKIEQRNIHKKLSILNKMPSYDVLKVKYNFNKILIFIKFEVNLLAVILLMDNWEFRC